MRLTSQLLVAGLAPLTHAFPAMIFEAAANDPAIVARAAEIEEQLKARQAGADLRRLNTIGNEANGRDPPREVGRIGDPEHAYAGHA